MISMSTFIIILTYSKNYQLHDNSSSDDGRKSIVVNPEKANYFSFPSST
jgi:hypothetical protein